MAPVLAAIGALVALLKDCSIEVERACTGEQLAPTSPIRLRKIKHAKVLSRTFRKAT